MWANSSKVVIRGGGDLGSACAVRLHRCGFRVIILEAEAPLAVRRTVAFSEAVHDGRATVENVQGVLVPTPDATLSARAVAVLVDPDLISLQDIAPAILVDATLAKRNMGMRRDLAGGTVGLGPGFEAGIDVDAVVETNRGPDLGRVFWTGRAQEDTGEPAPVGGYSAKRVLRAPATGTLATQTDIGSVVDTGQVVAQVGESEVSAPFRGLVRGLLRNGSAVKVGQKIGDLDPRLDPMLCHKISDKGLAVAGGVLEAAMMLLRST